MSSSSITSIADCKKMDYKNGHGKWNEELELEIKAFVRQSLSYSDTTPLFERLMERFETHYSMPCGTIAQFERRSKKMKGDLWEHFCLLYLKAKGYGKCWLIGDLPTDIADGLNLKNRDMGIDIVVEHDNGYFAVQAKWRSNPHKKTKTSITWTQLSTFYSLCARSGPWLKYIVMTNCDYVRRQGKKYEKDQTIAKTQFSKCPREIWSGIAGLSRGYSLIDEDDEDEQDEEEEDKEEDKPLTLKITQEEQSKINRAKFLSRYDSVRAPVKGSSS